MSDYLESAHQRCEQLRHVAQKLADEKESLQARMKGAETLGLLLHETQAENTALKQKVDRLETALEKLDDHYSFMKKAATGQTPQSVGASRRVVEGLVKSNAKLQQEVQRLRAGDTSPRKEDWVLVTGELRRENQDLRTELTTAKTALQSLSSGDFSGDDSSHSVAAATELVRLSRRLSHSERRVKTKDVLIEGLSEQMEKLRAECDRLTDQVAHLQRDAKVKTEKSEQHENIEVVKDLQHKLKEKDSLIADLEENLKIVTMEKEEAIKVTNQWDTFCKGQQVELVTLRERKSRLEGELEEYRQAQDMRKREVDKVLMSAKTLVDRERQEKLMAQIELKKSKDKCELLEGKFNMVDEQLKKEYGKRQQLELEVRDLKGRTGDGDRIVILEQQVQLYKEDFETERADRERLQSEKEALREELNDAQLTIHRQRDHVRSLEGELRETKDRIVQRERPQVAPSRDRQAAGVVPLSDYDRRMAIEYQKRIEDQIKRQSSQQRQWRTPPGHTESDLVPRGFVDPGSFAYDGPASNVAEPADSFDVQLRQKSSDAVRDVERDSAFPDEEQRLPYASMTTGSRPVAQPTSDSDLESTVSILGGRQMVTRPSPQPFASLAGQLTSDSKQSSVAGLPSLGMLYSRPEDNLKNSMAPRQKGKGSLLVCPRCAASFPPKQGRDYIEHVDQCCSQP